MPVLWGWEKELVYGRKLSVTASTTVYIITRDFAGVGCHGWGPVASLVVVCRLLSSGLRLRLVVLKYSTTQAVLDIFHL
ncbi:hypothetical protein Pmani_010507 [Petrolisthes manimaculis]|uniref:Uncharacterized protein n=1 Tax=Petrolisthes manimaculis TaxID=1843537 RepID=A0AAE1Q200_9EUCA|nr:hypothetical protein Pmani_010507 [Petrolisthes manimaculis]